MLTFDPIYTSPLHPAWHT